ncbi:hypothetical protein N0V82_000124 [Gnomoniopsis sp. IMI 355080]|nr:hypothetical protein N0V82_000124 [Gnomoniopsis sp. IMI 355080]
MEQLNGFETQVNKENRRHQNQQNSAQAHFSDGHLSQGFHQPNFPMWASLQSNMGLNGADKSMAFQGPPMHNGSSAVNMDTAQSHMSSGLPPQFFTPSSGTPTNMNMGFFYQSHPGWPPAPPSQPSQQHADYNPLLGQQPASSAHQNAILGTPSSAHQSRNLSTMSAVKKSTSAAKDRHRLEITAPSKESGGVPDPTDAYLMRASFLPKRRNHPGPLLVVIDLNGTLLYRPSRKNSTSFESRHHAKEFVTYCVQTFWVVFWSSAKPMNVKGMVDQLLSKPLRKQVVGVWGRDKFGLTEQDYNKRTQCYKRLTKLWNDPLIKSSYPTRRAGFEGGCWDQGNTVLIDDSVEKARSEPHNAITLPEYLGGTDDKGDVLPKVHDYLNELCFQEDISAFMRAHPFKMS